MAKRSTWLAAAVISTAFFMQAGFSDQRGGQRPSPEQTAVSAISQSPALRVILLGTAAGPPVKLDRFQASTLVEAGSEKLLFDCGRGATLRLKQFGVPLGEIGKLFLTHLHSDHIVGIPDLYLTSWSSDAARKIPFEVWGPAGTQDMMDHLQKAFAFDIQIHRDIDEKISGDGIVVISHDIQESVVFEKNGVKVTAFVVDHGPVKPAYGYRVDYAGRSVVLSGDTRFSENLIKFSQGVDVLVHEVVDAKALRARLEGNHTPQQIDAIIAHHTTAEQAGQVFTRVKPRLAVYSHVEGADLIPPTRTTYSGPLEVGEDLMAITIGENIDVRRFKP